MINVALIDDHVIVRSGFAQLLSLETDIKIVAEFSSAAQARQGLPGIQAHVCIIDISMPDESGLSLLEDLPSGLACIMLSVHDSVAIIEKSLQLGALGYLSKRCSPDELIQAVREVATGKVYLTPELAAKLKSAVAAPLAINQLTKREDQISRLLANGLEIKTIADMLNLSPKTIHVHRANAMQKLHVKNNVALAKYFNNEPL
ncbi:UhpA [Psychromonas sp. CNPT3]|uniref:transcriptional regulator UhpA n=1 Tax=Psychromonas sp. CNPT3 TaxID=314282 RepID=UPI00006E9E36|nr:transcriptional regulator UhpA [Psychromonas sp. CNPT3]AGH80932.1 UhpA [Psychromonas sp. CNPT3]